MTPLRCTRLEASVLCLIAAVVVYQLVVPPPIGLNDNGDFARVMRPFCLSRLPGQEEEERYFVSKYHFDPEAYWDSGYVTSETLPVVIAIGLNRLVSRDGLFDVRVLGLIHTGLLLAAVWLLLLASRELGRTARAVFLILLIVTVTDVGYVQWFNTFYSESASYLFFLLGTGLAWRTIRRPGGVPLLLAWTLAAVLLVTAKPQNAPLGAALAVFAFQLRTFDAGRAWRRSCAGAAAALLVSSAVYSRITPRQEMREMGHYGAVFYGILVDSPNPAQDLSELGLSPGLAVFVQRDPYLPDSGVDQPEFRQSFFARISYGKIAWFYATHPARLLRALDRDARQALLLRPEGMANFERDAGKGPNAESHTFELWSLLHARFYPRRLASLAAALGVYLAALALVRRKRTDQPGRLEIDLVHLILVMAVIGFGVVTMAVGIMDPTKQMLLVDVLTDASLLAAATWTTSRLAERLRPAAAAGR